MMKAAGTPKLSCHSNVILNVDSPAVIDVIVDTRFSSNAAFPNLPPNPFSEYNTSHTQLSVCHTGSNVVYPKTNWSVGNMLSKYPIFISSQIRFETICLRDHL